MKNHIITNTVCILFIISGLHISGCKNTDNQNNDQNNNQELISQPQFHKPTNIFVDALAITLNQTEFEEMLTQHKWSLYSAKDIQGKFLDKFITPKAQLNFNGTQNNLSNTFSIGCNGMGGDISLQGQQMTTALPIYSTTIACPDDLDKLDKEFAGAVTQVSDLSFFKKAETTILRQVTANGTELVWVNVVD